MSRWDAFSDVEIEDLVRALAVAAIKGIEAGVDLLMDVVAEAKRRTIVVCLWGSDAIERLEAEIGWQRG